MVATTKTRRRWFLTALLATLLIVIALIAWNLRPLSPVERKLVGNWMSPSRYVSPGHAVLRLKADRTFEMNDSFEGSGTWSASNGRLTLKYRASAPGSSWRSRLSRWVADLRAGQSPFERCAFRFESEWLIVRWDGSHRDDSWSRLTDAAARAWSRKGGWPTIKEL
jgi:hypothetical protein